MIEANLGGGFMIREMDYGFCLGIGVRAVQADGCVRHRAYRLPRHPRAEQIGRAVWKLTHWRDRVRNRTGNERRREA